MLQDSLKLTRAKLTSESTAVTSSAAAAPKEPHPAGSTPAMTVVSNSVSGQQAGLNRTGTEKQKHTGLDKGVMNGQTYCW